MCKHSHNHLDSNHSHNHNHRDSNRIIVDKNRDDRWWAWYVDGDSGDGEQLNFVCFDDHSTAETDPHSVLDFTKLKLMTR